MKFSALFGWFEGSYENRIKAASEAGFRAFENLDWVNYDLDAIAPVLKEYSFTSTALFCRSADEEVSKMVTWRHGMVWEDSIPYIVQAFKETAEAAKKLGTPTVVMITGDERSEVSREVQAENCVKALRTVAPIAEDAGLTVALEPLNRLVDHRGYFLNRSDEAFRIIKEVDSPAVKVLFDVYHQQITEGNLIRNITENIDLIGHMHIADNPGRNEPGSGEINYPNVLSAIKSSGYGGWIAFECGNTEPPAVVAEKMRRMTMPFED